MNMLMIAPLCDSRGKLRYFIGAQVDVSGLVKECTDLDSLQQLIERQRPRGSESGTREAAEKDDFQDLSEMLNMVSCEKFYVDRQSNMTGDISSSFAYWVPVG